MSLRKLLLAASLSAAGWGSSLSGVVIDPQGGVIPGATAALTCRGYTQRAAADSLGRFTFIMQPGSCRLRITHPGFAALEQPVPPDKIGPFTLRLELAEPQFSVRVLAAQPVDRLDYASLQAADLSGARLQKISNRTPDLIRYAKQVAGAGLGEDNIYVDGMPATSLPPAETIARISVNADPFSAEFNDGDQNHIEITTRATDRQLQFHFGGASLGAGGGNPLGTAQRPASGSSSFSLSGAVPHSPVTFSLNTSLACNRRQEPILAAMPGETPPAAPSSLCADSVLFSAAYERSENLRIHVTSYDSRSRSSNMNVGGLTLPDAGMGTAMTSREQRGTIERQGTTYLYNGGLRVSTSSSHVWADNQTLGVSVPGSFLAGGAPVWDSRSNETEWMTKSLIRSSYGGHVWSAGATASHGRDTDFTRPNTAGRLQFETVDDYLDALAGARSGTWSGERGNGMVQYASTSIAPFGEIEVVHTKRALVRGGIRVDYQSRAGGTVSPRLAAAVERAGFAIRAGGGIFFQDWQNSLLLQIMRGDGNHLRHFVAGNLSFADVPPLFPAADVSVFSAIAPGVVRPRSYISQTSIERPWRRWTAGAEYRWTNSVHLLGSRRSPTEGGWIDWLESNRVLRRHEGRARLAYRWKSHSVVLHYARVRSRDNTDGPFSFPARQDDLRAEWARSTGVAPNNVDVVGTFQLPGAVSLSAVAEYRSAAPYNITSGLDAAGNFLYTDRAGRPRNSGDRPPCRLVSLFFHRTVELPYRPRSKQKLRADVGLQLDNVLNARNYTSMGGVLGSPLFGKPLSALAGRSARLWFTFGPVRHASPDP